LIDEIQLKLGRIEAKLDGTLLLKDVKESGDLLDIIDPDQLLKLSREKFKGEK